jgi:hypothetical protein
VPEVMSLSKSDGRSKLPLLSLVLHGEDDLGFATGRLENTKKSSATSVRHDATPGACDYFRSIGYIT